MRLNYSSKGNKRNLFRTGACIIFLTVFAAVFLFSIFGFASVEEGSVKASLKEESLR